MTRWRRASSADAVGLRDLERSANLVGLAHVFGALPYPDAEILARWRDLLAHPGVTVDVVDGGGDEEAELVACVAHDAGTLRHLAVRPDAWGRGLGRSGVARAVDAGAKTLWVLEPNHRARGLYEALGWTASGTVQECPWPPHPVELQYRLDDRRA